MRDLKSLLIIILCFLLPLVACVYFGWDANAELNDETLKEVEKLRWKHYSIGIADNNILFASDIEWNRDYLRIWIEGDKLFVETQDGKWFIEMEKVNE